MISHGSDSDARRRSFLLRSIAKGTFGLTSPSFIVKAPIINGFPGLMNQDPIHVAKKMRNPLLSAKRDIFSEEARVVLNHVALVMVIFSKDEHG